MRTAEIAARRGHWQRAYSFFDWAIIGIDDEFDVQVKALAQLTAALSGRGHSAELPWQEIPPEAEPIASEAVAQAMSRWGIEVKDNEADQG
jgi:hypothetical protein